MTGHTAVHWDLADLAAIGDLAAEHGVVKSAACNWTTRYPDFPAPLVELSTGAVYSRLQVRNWYARQWPSKADHPITSARA